MRLTRFLIVGCILGLSACSNDGLRQLSQDGEGPDEFLILPGQELTQPENYTALPTPVPGASNRADVDPLGAASAALGGSSTARFNTASIGSSDGALVNHTSRLGRDADIRSTLAAEDEAFRKRRGRFTNIRIVNYDVYNEVYKREILAAYDEWWRWRRAGARTPAAPPTGG